MTTDSAAQRRRELGDFLRARRGQLARAPLGLSDAPRGRTTGLRREEVSLMSGVSMTWYTWLEQGREMNPSRQVIDAVARTLALSPAEHTYVLGLAGYAGERPARTSDRAPAHVQRLLDALDTSPAFAIEPDWHISGWNRAYAALYPNVGTVPDADRNLLYLVFTDPYVRELLPDWDVDSRRFLAEFRAEVGARLGDPAVAAVVDRLRSVSAEFRSGWDGHGVEGFASRERRFHHPMVGDMVLEHHRLAPSDHPGLHIVVYTAGRDAATRLETLLAERQS
jgi:transcriptional regulator with XRE-family HTH domain